MLNLLLICILLLAIVHESEGCFRRRRRRRPPPTPAPTPLPTPAPTPQPTPKPTPAPTPIPPPPSAPVQPDAPPPIVKIVRQAAGVMSRNNCKQVKITAANQDSLAQSNEQDVSERFEAAKKALENEGVSDQCINAEDFEYECEFSVYTEIALNVIYHPTGCGCAFTIQVVQPRPDRPEVTNLLSVDAAYSTEVTRFSIVVFDLIAQQVEAEIPEFANMAVSAETTQAIKDQINIDPNGNYQSITVGFAGTIKGFDKLPPQLDLNDPKNRNFVPALAFNVQQKYRTGSMFKVPCKLEMHTAPNAYMSQCQPFRPNDQFSYAKRHSLQGTTVNNDVAWFREFYLFPKQTSKCGSSGYTPQSRYITSFYNDNRCAASSGYLSFDREFKSTFDSSEATVGGWKWSREFSESRVVFGVPVSFASLMSVWCLGYSQITWGSPSKFARSDVPITKGVCKSFPANWTPTTQENKYQENHPSFPVDGVQCEPAFAPCNRDVTLLGFQNQDPRDFEKRPQSTLLTGPRRLFCTNAPQDLVDPESRVVFDTLTFRGVKAGEALAKRNWDDSEHPEPHQIHMVYSDEHNGLLHGRHAPHLVHAFNRYRRKRGEEPMIVDPVAGAPHRDSFGLNMAGGSVDSQGSDGAGAGDHPLKPFPETYSAPLTLDPVQSASREEPLVYDGKVITGVPPKFCEPGSIGCTCRDQSASSECDAPYTCNSLKYCVRPACPAGKPGCQAHSDGTCDEGLQKGSDGACVYASNCKAGDLGCRCKADSTCGEGDCLDNLCIRAKNDLCSSGEPGCPCDPADGSCSNSASCDGFTGLCLFKSCTPGSPGCDCALQGSPCTGSNVCNADKKCVEAKCIPGEPGCTCLASRKCNKKGFRCVELTRDGSQTACVGEDLCSKDQTQRCVDECGRGNVAACGKCDYSMPICKDPTVQYCNPNSYLYKIEPCPYDPESTSAGATTIVSALVAVVAAFVVAF